MLLGRQRQAKGQHHPGRAPAHHRDHDQADQQAVRPRLLHHPQRRRQDQGENHRRDRDDALGHRSPPQLPERPDGQHQPRDDEGSCEGHADVAENPSGNDQQKRTREIGEAGGRLAGRHVGEGHRVRVLTPEHAAGSVLEQDPDVDRRPRPTRNGEHGADRPQDKGDEQGHRGHLTGRPSKHQRDDQHDGGDARQPYRRPEPAGGGDVRRRPPAPDGERGHQTGSCERPPARRTSGETPPAETDDCQQRRRRCHGHEVQRAVRVRPGDGGRDEHGQRDQDTRPGERHRPPAAGTGGSHREKIRA